MCCSAPECVRSARGVRTVGLSFNTQQMPNLVSTRVEFDECGSPFNNGRDVATSGDWSTAAIGPSRRLRKQARAQREQIITGRTLTILDSLRPLS